jgi:hypothetical protein
MVDKGRTTQDNGETMTRKLQDETGKRTQFNSKKITRQQQDKNKTSPGPPKTTDETITITIHHKTQKYAPDKIRRN